MKNTFNNISESEKGRILEMHYNQYNKHYIKEDVTDISAGPTPILTILANPTMVNVKPNPSDQTSIYLSARDKNGKQIGSAHKYKISGTYDPGRFLPNVNFDIKIREAIRATKPFGKKGQPGDLYVEVQPNNIAVRATMKELIPSEDLTTDGWLIVNVKNDKVTEAINKLKSNNGNSAVMDAGHGVGVTLKKALK